MLHNHPLTLINPETGNLAFQLYPLEDASRFEEIQRLNYYSLIWIKQGSGTVKADFSEFAFSESSLFAFAPYQPFTLDFQDEVQGVVIHFHPDFFCIHKHQQEVACNGVLYNNIYQKPFVEVDEATAVTLDILVDQLQTEVQNVSLAQYEVLISYLKIVLITASRLKVQQSEILIPAENKEEPFILQNLKNFIEIHFKTKHSASDYADLLNITPKALAKITKTHFNKTISDLIAERIIIEAKRELYLTNKQVKEIAYELGYDDEFYFSRFFKNKASISPQIYRETVGFGRGV